MKLTLMTYNIQHGHIHRSDPGRIALGEMAEVIRESGADIIGLNEVRGRGPHPEYTAQVEEMAADLGFHCFFGRSICVGGPNPYGNAVLSRWPICEAKVFHIPDPCAADQVRRFEHRSILRAVVELPEGGEFAVFSSHFGLTPPEQKNAVTLASALTGAEKLPFALMGDFNVTPDDPVLAPLDERLNTTHAFLEGQFSHPSHAPVDRIDYIYVSKSVKVIAAEVLPAQASDHRPVRAEVEIPSESDGSIRYSE